MNDTEPITVPDADSALAAAANLLGSGPGVVIVENPDGGIETQAFGGLTMYALPIFLRKTANALERQITG